MKHTSNLDINNINFLTSDNEETNTVYVLLIVEFHELNNSEFLFSVESVFAKKGDNILEKIKNYLYSVEKIKIYLELINTYGLTLETNISQDMNLMKYNSKSIKFYELIPENEKIRYIDFTINVDKEDL